jgi:hypothetical protein
VIQTPEFDSTFRTIRGATREAYNIPGVFFHIVINEILWVISGYEWKAAGSNHRPGISRGFFVHYMKEGTETCAKLVIDDKSLDVASGLKDA